MNGPGYSVQRQARQVDSKLVVRRILPKSNSTGNETVAGPHIRTERSLLSPSARLSKAPAYADLRLVKTRRRPNSKDKDEPDEFAIQKRCEGTSSGPQQVQRLLRLLV